MLVRLDKTKGRIWVWKHKILRFRIFKCNSIVRYLKKWWKKFNGLLAGVILGCILHKYVFYRIKAVLLQEKQGFSKVSVSIVASFKGELQTLKDSPHFRHKHGRKMRCIVKAITSDWTLNWTFSRMCPFDYENLHLFKGTIRLVLLSDNPLYFF